MQFAHQIGELEIRRAAAGSRQLRGRFPYRKRAVLSDGGRNGKPKKEEFAPRAFAYRINRPSEDIHLLTGHDYGQPLASRGAGTLDIADGDAAVTFTATITAAMLDVSWVQDALASIESGLFSGISPGFQIPPKRAVAEPETFSQEAYDPSKGMYAATIRTINAALLYEMSVVTRPAYQDTHIATDDGSAIDDATALVKAAELDLAKAKANGDAKMITAAEDALAKAQTALDELVKAASANEHRNFEQRGELLVPTKKPLAYAMNRWRA
jgi:uncharacterized protein